VCWAGRSRIEVNPQEANERILTAAPGGEAGNTGARSLE